MRKLLAAALAVLMLCGAFAAFPASAAGSTPVKTIDGTTVNDYYDCDLVVTEVMVNSKSNVDKFNDIADTLSTSKTSSYDCFDYIEIYNRGDEAINLYDYCLLRADNYGVTPVYQTEGTFTHQNYIAPGSIYQSAYGVNSSLKKWDVTNPLAIRDGGSKDASESLHWIQPGQFAVIWFWTSQCDAVSQHNGTSMANPNLNYSATQNAYYYPQFREFYNVPDETVVLAVYAQNNATNAPKCFDLVAGKARMYGIASKDFDVAEPAIENVGSTFAELNDKIECLFTWGTGTKAGIPTTDGMDHYATNYLPANATPNVYNAEKAQYGNYDAAANYDFVQTGHSLSYKEMAIFRYALDPTVGSMPLYQWAYVDPEGLMNNWYALAERAENEVAMVVRQKVYESVKAEITAAVNADAHIAASQKPAAIEERMAAADASGGEVDRRTNERLSVPSQLYRDMWDYFKELCREIISDYDKVMAYKIAGTDQPLLVDEDGDLLTNVVSGEYVWASRVIERSTQEMAWILPEVPAREEELIEILLVERDELMSMHGTYNAPPVRAVETAELDGSLAIPIGVAVAVVSVLACLAAVAFLSAKRRKE